jgi:hypothetical protein
METSPYRFAPLMTFTAAFLGGAVSLISVWLTQRYGLQAQLAVRRADAEAIVTAALRAEREKRYLAFVQNIDSLWAKAQEPARKAELLKTVRELGLVGDPELVRKLRISLVDIAGNPEADAREELFGEVMLDMRKGLGVSCEQLNKQDFRFLAA